MHPPLCLFLFLLTSWITGAAAHPIQKRHVLKDSKYLEELTDVKKSTLFTFFSALADWTSWLEEEAELTNRQERTAFQQPQAWEKSLCRNFFWKTFLSC